MGNLLLPVSILKGYSELVIFATFLFTFTSIFRKDFKFDLKEWCFSFLKSIGYIFLALIIYRYYIKLDLIPVLDFFTFILAAFEGGHNFVNSSGLFLAGFVRIFYANKA